MKSVIWVVLLPMFSLAQEMPLICLNSGACYQGSWLASNAGNQYASFQGIRYAEAPIGNLRFRPPKLFQSGEALWDVSQESLLKCSQLDMYDMSLQGQEDCLFLNIFVPKSAMSQDELQPVMFWIHGGSLIHGSNRFDDQGPQDYMDRNVIIVTVNYRLGPLGFLSLGTEEVSGNAGFLDQNLALQWVNQNIQAFHGDPNSVTLFGESAGALSVAVQYLSPMSQGLFQRIILQSSSTEAPGWGMMNKTLAIYYGDVFTQMLECNEVIDALDCLQSKTMEEVINLTYQVNTDGGNVWLAVPDDKFLMDDPTTLLEQGQFDPNVEVIVSTTKDEGILYLLEQLADPSKWQETQDNFEFVAPRLLFNIPYFNQITPSDVEKSYEIFEHYIGSIENLNENHLQGIFDIFTDATFLFGLHKTTNYLLAQNVKVYQAILTYHGEHSFSEGFGVGNYGVCHADDLFYLWNMRNVTLTLEEDIKVKNLMTDAWTNFAKYGDPTPPGSELTWLPVDDPEMHQFWNISGAMPQMATSQQIQDRMNFWYQIVQQN